MSPEDTQQGLFPEAPPPAKPAASPQQLADLLARLKLWRAALIDSYVARLEPDEPVSALQPLATVEGVIAAISESLCLDEMGQVHAREAGGVGSDGYS